MPVTYPASRPPRATYRPVFLDSAATVDKAVSLIGEAAKAGASLVAFPEGFMPGFPVWAALRAPIHNHDFFRGAAARRCASTAPEIDRCARRRAAHGVHVSLGFTEGTDASVGCIWNSNVLIGPDGTILNHHRKLVPTFYEKLIWANGDARGLRVTQTEIGRIGMLICGENTNPLSRYALMAEGEQVHISTYPPFWPTRPPRESGGYDLRRAIEIRAGSARLRGQGVQHRVVGIRRQAMMDGSARERQGRDRDHGAFAAQRVDDPGPERQAGRRAAVRARGHRLRATSTRRCHRAQAVPRRGRLLQPIRHFPSRVDRSRRDPARFGESVEDAPADPAPTPRRTRPPWCRSATAPAASASLRLSAAQRSGLRRRAA